MNARCIIQIFAGILLMMMSSCSRDHLYYDAISRSQVQLNIDWSQTAFSVVNSNYDRDNLLNGVTVFAFDAETQQLSTELPPDANWKSPRLSLNPGIYHLIVINDSRAELPAINFDISQPFEEFCAYLDVDTVYTEYPDYLTVSSVRNVNFKSSFRDYFYDQPEDYITDFVTEEIDTEQHPVTKKVNIRAYIKGMNYCRGMQPSFISGLAKSVDLATEIPGRQKVVYAFNLINLEYRNSEYTEALLTQSFNSYGFSKENLQTGTKFELTLNFVLVDNSIHTAKADVTEQLEQWLIEHMIAGNPYQDIDIEIEVTLPPVSPCPSDAEGFVPETLPWNDITQNIVI